MLSQGKQNCHADMEVANPLTSHTLVVQDDLESLGYAFLEMFIGDLLW